MESENEKNLKYVLLKSKLLTNERFEETKNIQSIGRKISFIFILLLNLSISIFAFYFYFSYQPTKESETKTIKGQLNSYSVIKRGKSNELIMRLKEYNTGFKVQSIPFESFAIDKFNSDEYDGLMIKCKILKKDIQNLNINKEISLYGVESEKNIYITLDDVNNRESSNAKIALVLAIIFSGTFIFLSINLPLKI
jgi:hypothetical protein